MAANPYTTALNEQEKKLTQPTQTVGAPQPSTPFRSDINAEKDRQSKERIESIKAVAYGMKEAAKTGYDVSKISGGKVPAAYQQWRSAMDAQNPAFNQINTATSDKILQNLNTESEGLGQSGRVAMSDFTRTAQEIQRQAKEQAIKLHGAGSQQVSDATQAAGQQNILNMADFRSRLAAGDEEARRAQDADKMANALQYIGQEGQRQLGEASLAQSDSQFNQNVDLERDRLEQGAFQFSQQLGLDQKALQQAKDQFNADMAQRQTEFQGRLGLDAQTLAQNQGQFLARLGLDEKQFEASLDQFAQQMGLDKEALRQQLFVAEKGFDIQREQMRINANQFLKTHGLNVSELDQRVKEFAAQHGLDERALAQQLEVEKMRLSQAAEQFDRTADLDESRFAQSIEEFAARYNLDERSLMQQYTMHKEAQIHDKEIAEMGFDFQSRQQLASQQFQAAQSKLDRELQTLSQDKQIHAQQVLQQSQQVFDQTMAQEGYLHDEQMQKLTNNFQLVLQQRGFDQQTATMIAQLNHDKMMAANEQTFTSQQAELDRAWRSGERISSEQFQIALTDMEQRFQSKENELSRVLQLDMQENQFAFQNAVLEAEQVYNDSVIKQNFTNEMALAASNQAFQQTMQEAGFDHDKVIQAQRLQQEMSIFSQELASRENQFMVQSAMEDSHFMAQLGIQQQNVDLNRQQLKQQLQQFNWSKKVDTRNYRLDEKQVTAALESAETQEKLTAASIALEMMPDDEDALKPFVEPLFRTLANQLDIPEDQIEKAVSGFSTMGRSTTENGVDINQFKDIDVTNMSEKQFQDNLNKPGFTDYLKEEGVVKTFEKAGDWTLDQAPIFEQIKNGPSRGIIEVNGQFFKIHADPNVVHDQWLGDANYGSHITLIKADNDGKFEPGDKSQNLYSISLEGAKQGQVLWGGVDKNKKYFSISELGG